MSWQSSTGSARSHHFHSCGILKGKRRTSFSDQRCLVKRILKKCLIKYLLTKAIRIRNESFKSDNILSFSPNSCLWFGVKWGGIKVAFFPKSAIIVSEQTPLYPD